MSNLMIALASLGGVVLAGVVAHGAWQAKKAGPKRAIASPREEPSAGAPHREEQADDAVDAIDIGEAGSTVDAREPSFASALRLPRRLPLAIDALIDAVVALTLDAPVSGETVLAHLPRQRRIGSKSLLFEGLNVAAGRWETPVAGERYGELQAGVQLANRTGPLNEIEYSEFVQVMQAMADSLGASIETPDMMDVMARARELDTFAGAHDAQLAVHLHARGAAWSVGYIQQHARRHGFVPGVVPGRLVYPAAEEGAPPVLTLTFDSQAALADDPDRAAVRDATLAFDVPQTEAAAEPFGAWQAASQALAVGMDAAIVDDNERPLSGEGFASIGQELAALYEALAARDLAAGSPAARRLFS